MMATRPTTRLQVEVAGRQEGHGVGAASQVLQAHVEALLAEVAFVERHVQSAPVGKVQRPLNPIRQTVDLHIVPRC